MQIEMNEQIVSIVIPMYNVEAYIEDCIRSVTEQTCRELEILCIDDASTDETLKRAQELAVQDGRIRIFRNDKNRGPSYTRNRGLDLASGKYIYFLDSDDMITPNAIEELRQEADKKELDVLFFDGQVLFEEEALKEKFVGYSMEHCGEYPEVMSGVQAFRSMRKNREWAVNVPREFWRREFLTEEGFRFEDGILHEDELFSTLVVLAVKRCSVSKEQYFIRRLRSNSIMTTERTVQNMQGYLRCLSRLLESFAQQKNGMEQDEMMQDYLQYLKKLITRTQFTHCEWTLKTADAAEFVVKNMLELEWYQTFSKQDLQKLSTAEEVLIYGAGKAARRIFGELLQLEIPVKGFVVTERKEGEETLFGLPIRELSEYQDIRKPTFVISIMNRDIAGQVERLLYSRGAVKVILPHYE